MPSADRVTRAAVVLHGRPEALGSGRERLEAVAAQAYGASDPAMVVAAPGTQVLISLLPHVLRHDHVAVLGPTYAEHAAAWAAAGTVVLMSPTSGYGNYTCVAHGGGISTCYAHQSRFGTSSGAHVSQGQVIGYVGCTGHCFGPHLHFEVRVNGAPVNPLGYL